MSDSGFRNGRYRRAGRRSGSDDQSLLRYWTVLRERMWLVIGATAVVLVIAIVYAEVAPKTYKAQAQIEVQPSATGDSVLSTLPVLHSSGDPTQDVLTAASLVTTRPVADAVVTAEKLTISPADALGKVSASPVGQASLVAVVASASSPSLAQKLANGFATQTIALSTARMHATINRELPSLNAQLARIPAAQRFGTGSLGQEISELTQLLQQNDPTLTSTAPATLPTGPSSPRKKLAILAGLIAGLIVGVAAAFIAHALDQRLRREEQLRDELGLPIYARIPRQPRVRPRPLLPSEMNPAGNEGYRTLRTILAARSAKSDPQAFLVTSSAPSEGKSTTSLGLAGALAQAGSRVIMIEADMRRPTFAETFELTNFVGIEQVLAGEAPFLKALNRVTVDGETILVLAAHPSTGAVAGGVSFSSVRELVEEAKSIADFVVIDTPPLTAVIDALPFAKPADEVLIVARLDATRLDRLAELDGLLGENGITRMGVVLIGGDATGPSEYYDASPAGRGRMRRGGNTESEGDVPSLYPG